MPVLCRLVAPKFLHFRAGVPAIPRLNTNLSSVDAVFSHRESIYARQVSS